MDPALLDPLVKLFGSAPWLGYVALAAAALTTLVSWVVTGCSVAAKILDTKNAAGAFIFDYPRLRAIVDAVALNRSHPSP